MEIVVTMIKEEFIDTNDVRMVEEHEVIDDVLNNDEQDEEEDDNNIVVREIDVYLSTEMQKQLYLLQYPLQQVQVQEQRQERNDGSNNKTTKNSNQLQPISQVRIKPRHNRLDIIHPIPLQQMEDTSTTTRTNRYSELYERTYTSQPIPIVTHMCIGKLKLDPTTNDTTFHLIPLQHIYQMRPTFDHIDNDNNNDNYTVQSVTFQQQLTRNNNNNKESERAQMARLNSYMYKKQSEENELWYELQLLDNYSIHYHTFIKKMIVSYYLLQKPDTIVPFVLKPKVVSTDAMDTTTTTDTSITELTTTTNNTTTSGSTNENISVSVITIKVLSLLRYGWQVPYQLIRHQFVDTIKISDTILLSILNSCCVLVRGNFTLQSKYVILNDTFADDNNSKSIIIQPIRTFILLLLHLYGYIQRPALTNVFVSTSKSNKISSEMIGQLLEMNCKLIKHYSPYSCVHRTNDTDMTTTIEQVQEEQQQQHISSSSSSSSSRRRGWVPKIDDDITIEKLFPDTVQLHNLYWEQQTIRFHKQLQLYNKYKHI